MIPGKPQYYAIAILSQLLLHTSCISLYTIIWNVNYTACAWTLSDPPGLVPPLVPTGRPDKEDVKLKTGVRDQCIVLKSQPLQRR